MNNFATWVRLVALSMAWGTAFLLIRIAVPSMGPSWLVELRVLIAGCLLLAWASWQRQPLRFREHAWLYIKLGALNSALPFVLVAWGEIALPASLSAILIATTPLFTALIVMFQSGGAPSWSRLLGMLAGLSGVIVLMGGLNQLGATPDYPAAVAATLLAAASYAWAAVYTARVGCGIPPLTLATGSQFGAALILAILLPWVQVPGLPDVAVVMAILGLAAFSSAAAFLLYFRLIQDAGSVATTTVNFLAPLFGVVGGHLCLEETLTQDFQLGAACVLCGSYLVLRRR
jgi:drug/metabolite transporter (DMT)-like permease